jgi:hypothetical protein
MLRIRLLAALAGALLAALAVATIAAADDDGGSRARDNAFGVGNFGPACWQTHGGPFCSPFNYTMRVLGVQRGAGDSAWGVFERRNHGTGRSLSGQVTCMNVEGNRASIGGVFDQVATQPGFGVGDPFVFFVEDNGTLGSSNPDQISALAALPEGDPDRPLMPARFPYVCPPADSIYGYAPLLSGDFTVAEGAVSGGDEDD